MKKKGSKVGNTFVFFPQSLFYLLYFFHLFHFHFVQLMMVFYSEMFCTVSKKLKNKVCALYSGLYYTKEPSQSILIWLSPEKKTKMIRIYLKSAESDFKSTIIVIYFRSVSLENLQVFVLQRYSRCQLLNSTLSQARVIMSQAYSKIFRNHFTLIL